MTPMTIIPTWIFEWFHGRDHGMSSETIAAAYCPALAPALSFGPSLPSDADDVGRCVRFLRLAESKGAPVDMAVVAATFPEWAPLVARWPEIEAAYHADIAAYNAWKVARWTRKDGQKRRYPSKLPHPPSAVSAILKECQ